MGHELKNCDTWIKQSSLQKKGGKQRKTNLQLTMNPNLLCHNDDDRRYAQMLLSSGERDTAPHDGDIGTFELLAKDFQFELKRIGMYSKYFAFNDLSPSHFLHRKTMLHRREDIGTGPEVENNRGVSSGNAYFCGERAESLHVR